MTDDPEIEILLVEDDPDDAALVMRALKQGRCLNKVHWVTDGQQALDYLCGAGEHASGIAHRQLKLILLDLNMPKIGGIEVLKHIRFDARLREIPVVVMTASRDEGDVRRCHSLGVNSYIVKPVEFSAFAQAVAQTGMSWVLTDTPGRRGEVPAL